MFLNKTIIKQGFVCICYLLCTACSQPTIPTLQPTRGNIQQSFSELAQTRLEDVYNVNMSLSGDIGYIDLEPGDTVKKDQKIAQIKLLPWQQVVTSAEATLKSVKINHQKSAIDLERMQTLYKKGFIAKADLDTSISDEKEKQSQLDTAESDLAVAKYNFELTTIRSPIDGTILQVLTHGQKWLPSGTILVQIGRLEELEAVSDVLTQQALLLKLGDKVILTSNGHKLEGQVKRIDPAGFTKQSSLGVEEQRVSIIISLPKERMFALGLAYYLQATFLVGEPEKNVLIIPRFSVLQDEQDHFYVFKVLHNHKLKKQIISIGIMTDREISVKSGLNDKDILIAQPSADMYEGMKI
jgi:RND family efflux transporter MFP subunit